MKRKCKDCGKESEKSRCPNCILKIKNYCKTRYDSLKIANLCTKCGQPVVEGFTKCLEHRAADKTSYHKDKESYPERILLNTARYRANIKKVDFQITLEDVSIPEFCPILNIPLVAGAGVLHDNSPTLDRIIPEKGYIPGNVQVISYRANRIKSDGTIAEHRQVSEWMQTNLITNPIYVDVL